MATTRVRTREPAARTRHRLGRVALAIGVLLALAAGWAALLALVLHGWGAPASL